MGTCSSLHDVQVRLLAFVQEFYHADPHSGLIGRCPADLYYNDGATEDSVSEDELCEAMTVRTSRRVRRDGTLAVGGIDWEVDAGFLAGKKVTVARTLFDPQRSPWIEHDEQRYNLEKVDPIANGKQPRSKRQNTRRGVDAIDFDPVGALVDRMLGKNTKSSPT